MPNDDADRYRAPALDKGLDILELLAATEESLSQAEIAKALERSPNEIYRMLNGLVRRNYVRRTAADRYELTMKLFELAHMRPPLRRLISQSVPVLRRFAQEAEQPGHLVIYDRNALIVVAQADAPTYWSVAIRVGSRISLVNTGSGHVFLAYATPEEREIMMQEYDNNGHAISIPEGLAERLRTVRANGYETMASMQTLGVTNLSVPILGPQGTVIAALTCPYTERLDKPEAPDKADVLRMLMAASEEISQRPGIAAAAE